MLDSNDTFTDLKPSFFGRNNFLFMIIIAIFISFALVWASLYIYSTSGSAQLDLSRPGYVDVRDKTVDSSSEFKNYATFGAIDQASIDEFKELYDNQVDKIKLAAAFKGDPLSPDSLGINLVISQ